MNPDWVSKISIEKVIYLNCIDSTNNYAKSLASKDELEDFTLIIAERQFAGKGRLGNREWASNNEKGLWMSLCLTPKIKICNLQIITLAAAVAVVIAIKKIIDVPVQIKWPNDILLDGKKVCGILVESQFKYDIVTSLIVGIGINISQQRCEFPYTIADLAISLQEYCGNAANTTISELNYLKTQLTNHILLEFYKFYDSIIVGNISCVMMLWEKYSLELNNRVQIIYASGEKYEGTVTGLSSHGNLCVNCDDGVTKKIVSVQASICLI